MDQFKGFAEKTKHSIKASTAKLSGSQTLPPPSQSPPHDEENPFEDEDSYNQAKPLKSTSQAAPPKKKKKSTQNAANAAPAAYADAIPPVTKQSKSKSVSGANHTGLSAEALAARDRELAEREKKLAEMEKQLEQRQAQVEKLAGKMKNWPFKFYPILYHSIPDEIPAPQQKIVSRFYWFWKFMCVCLIVNFLAVCVIFGVSGSMGLFDIILSLAYCFLGIPGSFLLWYQPFYKTMKAKSSVSWSFFIVGFTIHWLYVICMGISIPWFAGAGILVFIKVAISAKAVSVIFNLVALCFWGLNWAITGYLTKKARDEYKAAGQNLAAMKSGFVGEAIKMQIRG